MKTCLISMVAVMFGSTSPAQSVRDQLQDLGVILYTQQANQQEEREKHSRPVIEYIDGVPQMPEMHWTDLSYMQWDIDALQAYGDAIDAYNARLGAQEAQRNAKIRAAQIQEYNAKVEAYNQRITEENKKRAALQQNHVQDAMASAIKLWPDLMAAGSSMNMKFAEVVRREKNENPTFFNDKDWPLILGKWCAEKVKSEEEEFIAKTNDFNSRAQRAFPDVNNPGSPLAKRIVQIADQMEADKDQTVYSPKALWVISHRAAQELGISPVP